MKSRNLTHSSFSALKTKKLLKLPQNCIQSNINVFFTFFIALLGAIFQISETSFVHFLRLVKTKEKRTKLTSPQGPSYDDRVEPCRHTMVPCLDWIGSYQSFKNASANSFKLNWDSKFWVHYLISLQSLRYLVCKWFKLGLLSRSIK